MKLKLLKLPKLNPSQPLKLPKFSESSEPDVDNSPPETIPVEKKQQYALTTPSNLDARVCLNLTENMDIYRCAENYR